MPSSITREIDGDSHVLSLVFPGTISAIQLSDPDKDNDDIVIIGCDQDDSASDIFLFEAPEGYDPEDDPDTLLDYCNSENLLSQLGHDDEFSVSVNMPGGEAAKFIIAHTILQALN